MDSLGLPFFTHCTKANVTDDQGLIEMLSINIDYFKSKPAELPKTTILLDNGYHPSKIEEELKQIYPEIMTKIQFELSAKPSKTEKEKQGKSGFVPVKTRWVIERSNSWMERCKSLVKNFERTLDHARTKLNLCFVRLMLMHIGDRLTEGSEALLFHEHAVAMRSPKFLEIPNGFYMFPQLVTISRRDYLAVRV